MTWGHLGRMNCGIDSWVLECLEEEEEKEEKTKEKLKKKDLYPVGARTVSWLMLMLVRSSPVETKTQHAKDRSNYGI